MRIHGETPEFDRPKQLFSAIFSIPLTLKPQPASLETFIWLGCISSTSHDIWWFLKCTYLKNCMVYFMANSTKMDDLGYPHFRKPPYVGCVFQSKTLEFHPNRTLVVMCNHPSVVTSLEGYPTIKIGTVVFIKWQLI